MHASQQACTKSAPYLGHLWPISTHLPLDLLISVTQPMTALLGSPLHTITTHLLQTTPSAPMAPRCPSTKINQLIARLPNVQPALHKSATVFRPNSLQALINVVLQLFWNCPRIVSEASFWTERDFLLRSQRSGACRAGALEKTVSSSITIQVLPCWESMRWLSTPSVAKLSLERQ